MRRHNPNNRTNRRQYREIARIEAFTMYCKHENLAKSDNFLACTTNEGDRWLSTSNIPTTDSSVSK